MFENIGSFFKKIIKNEPKELLVDTTQSKDAAKERLHIVLMQDRANVSADFLELMKEEIVDVIKKYIVVDENQIDVRLTNQENEDGTIGAPSLHANIPILNIRNDIKGEISRTDDNTEVVTLTENIDNDRTQIVELVKEAVEEVNADSKNQGEAKTLEIEIESKEIDSEEKTNIIIKEVEETAEEEKNDDENIKEESNNEEQEVVEESVEIEEQEVEKSKEDETEVEENKDVEEPEVNEESKTEETIEVIESVVEEVEEEDKPLTVDTDGNMNLEELESKLDEEDDEDDDVTFDDLLKAAEEEEKRLQSSDDEESKEEKKTKKSEKGVTPKKNTKKKTAKTKKNKKK